MITRCMTQRTAIWNNGQSVHTLSTEMRVPARHQHDTITQSQEADFTCCRPRRRGISCCCWWRSWTAGLLLLLVDVDVVVLVIAVDLFSEKPSAVYPQSVAYGAQKLQFVLSSGIISYGAQRLPPTRDRRRRKSATEVSLLAGLCVYATMIWGNAGSQYWRQHASVCMQTTQHIAGAL